MWKVTFKVYLNHSLFESQGDFML